MAHDPFFGPHSSSERRAAREEARRLRQELRANSFSLRRAVVAARSLKQEAQRVVTKSRWLSAAQENHWSAQLRCPKCGSVLLGVVPGERAGLLAYECLRCGQVWAPGETTPDVEKVRRLQASSEEADWIRFKCPKCGNTDVMAIPMNQPGTYCECFSCGHLWKLPEPAKRPEVVKKRA